MAEIILYLTKLDAKEIINWVNSESDIAWIIKDSQIGKTYRAERSRAAFYPLKEYEQLNLPHLHAVGRCHK